MPAKVELKFYIKEASRKIKDSALDKMAEAVNLLRNTTVETLSGNRTGRVYRVPGTRKTYRASSPGEPPAVASAELRQSIKTEIESKRGVIVGQVGTELKKGAMLESGTRNMKPRPWLRKSFEKAEDEIKDILGERWFR